MKKFLSLLLAAMMLCSCAVAMAESTDRNAAITVNTPTSQYDSDASSGTESATPSVNTEMWLQVDADGQIDVTVPLVLVFRTDIDGGYAASPDSYKLTNNGTADLAVTKLYVTPETTASGSQPMTFTTYNENITTTDNYGLKISVAATEEDKDNHRLAHEAYSKDMYGVIESNPETADPLNGGLFQIYKKTGKANDTSNETVVKAELSTGPLSFVTKHKAGENGAASTLDTAQGVKLITLNYTVAIDSQSGIGTTITTADEDFKALSTTGEEP